LFARERGVCFTDTRSCGANLRLLVAESESRQRRSVPFGVMLHTTNPRALSARSQVHTALLAVVAVFVGSACCAFWDVGPFPGPPLATIEGPEDPAVLQGTSGTLVVVDREDDSRLRIIRLPSLEPRTIDVVGRALCISGPDVDGRVAYLQYDEDRSTYSLRFVSLVDGGQTQLLERRGILNPMSWVAISPRGGLLAFTSSIDRGGYDYTPWVLEIVDIASGEVRTIDGAITQYCPCWCPDGKHLVLVGWRGEDRTSITSILDVISGDRHVVHEVEERETVFLSSDGDSLFFGHGEQLRRIDARSGTLLNDDVRLPGAIGSNVIDLDAHKFLYEARPTTGVDQRLRAGFMWPHDIKLCDAETGRFVTVVSQLWGMASYGKTTVENGSVDRSRSDP
jgi:hypothetical protein